jgi:hypothetical protein
MERPVNMVTGGTQHLKEHTDALLTLREALGFLYHISALTRYSRSGSCFCLCCCGRYASVMAMSREPGGIGGAIKSGTGV